MFLSTNDQYTLRLSVEQLFAQQNASTGQLHYVASPIYEQPESSFIKNISDVYSYTYHMCVFLRRLCSPRRSLTIA